MKKIFTTIILFSLVPIWGQVLTLGEAVNMALRQNQQIKRARNQVKIAENFSHPGQANLLPSVSLTGSNQNTKNKPNQGSEISSSVTSAKIQANYSLFNGFRNINQYKQLKSQESLTKLQSRSQIENVILSVIKSYYSVAEITENLNSQQRSLTISRERLERTRARKRMGQADSVDVLSAVVAYNRDSINVVRTRQNLKEAKRNLNQILNRDIAASFEVENEVDFIDLPERDTVNRIAFNNNAEYLATQKNLQLAEINKDMAQSSYFPSLNVTGSYGYNKEQQELGIGVENPSRNWNIGLSLNFALFNGFQRSIQNQNAKIKINNQRLTTQQEREELQKSISNALDRYQNSQRILSMEEENLKSARLNFERTQDAYGLGQVTSTRFREAQLNLIKARQGISQAKYNAKINESRILKIMGQLLGYEKNGNMK